jgi:hypothetical protein
MSGRLADRAAVSTVGQHGGMHAGSWSLMDMSAGM